MRIFLLLIIITVVFIGKGNAQTMTVTTRHEIPKQAGFKPVPIDENTIVKDSAGRELTYNEWQPLLRTGNYSLRSTQRLNEKPVYSLVRLTAAEKQYWAQKRQSAMANSSAGAIASQAASATKAVAQPVFDEHAIVRDSAGTIYPYAVWKALARTNDYYVRWFRRSDADSVTYTITKRTQAEKDALMATLPKPAESGNFKSGDTFSYFNEKDMTGERINAKALAGKVLVLNFWFIGCPPCRAELPKLNALAEQYKNNKDVVFVAIALDQGYEIRDFLKSHPFSYHIISDGQYTANKYGVNLYPTNAIINKEGKIVFSSVADQPANPYWIKRTIDESLAAK